MPTTPNSPEPVQPANAAPATPPTAAQAKARYLENSLSSTLSALENGLEREKAEMKRVQARLDQHSATVKDLEQRIAWTREEIAFHKKNADGAA